MRCLLQKTDASRRPPPPTPAMAPPTTTIADLPLELKTRIAAYLADLSGAAPAAAVCRELAPLALAGRAWREAARQVEGAVDCDSHHRQELAWVLLRMPRLRISRLTASSMSDESLGSLRHLEAGCPDWVARLQGAQVRLCSSHLQALLPPGARVRQLSISRPLQALGQAGEQQDQQLVTVDLEALAAVSPCLSLQLPARAELRLQLPGAPGRHADDGDATEALLARLRQLGVRMLVLVPGRRPQSVRIVLGGGGGGGGSQLAMTLADLPFQQLDAFAARWRLRWDEAFGSSSVFAIALPSPDLVPPHAPAPLRAAAEAALGASGLDASRPCLWSWAHGNRCGWAHAPCAGHQLAGAAPLARSPARSMRHARPATRLASHALQVWAALPPASGLEGPPLPELLHAAASAERTGPGQVGTSAGLRVGPQAALITPLQTPSAPGLGSSRRNGHDLPARSSRFSTCPPPEHTPPGTRHACCHTERPSPLASPAPPPTTA